MNLYQPPNAHFHLPRLPSLTDIRNVLQFEEKDMFTPTRSFERRADAAASTSQACTAGPNGDSCAKPTDASATLPIALGIAIPLTASLIAFFFLHRRYKRKLRAEDRSDEEKYKSMDFGMDLKYTDGKKKKPAHPDMNADGRVRREMKGLSMEATSPYLFPGGRRSTESLSSLARETYDADHRYAQVHRDLGKGDDMSIRSFRAGTPRGRSGTGTSSNPPYDGTSSSNLLGNAQAYPKSLPAQGGSLPAPPEPPHPSIQEPEKALLSSTHGIPQSKTSDGGLAPSLGEIPRSSFIDQTAFRKSNNYLRGFIHSREPSEEVKLTPPASKVESNTSTLVGSYDDLPKISVGLVSPPLGAATRPSPAHPAEKALPTDPRATFQSVEGSIHDAHSASYGPPSQSPSYLSDSTYDNEFKVTPPSPPHDRNSHASRDSASTYATLPARGQSLAAPMPSVEERRESQFLSDVLDGFDHNNQRLSVLMRPLPPDDPSEDPEMRANRIRSFYKEYFDESKAGQQQQHPPVPKVADHNGYAVDGYYDAQPDYDHYQEHNRSQPQLQHPNHGQSAGYYEDYDTQYMNKGHNAHDNRQNGFVVAAPYAEPVTRRAMTPPPRAPPRFQGGPRGRAFSGASQLPPRGMSSMSNYRSRPGPGSERGRTPNRAPGPAPQPLMSLKTPHLLKDDSALYGAFELAPPPSFRDRQAGRRPDSPLGVERPYSPSIRSHTPLASAFEELSAMPSPHLLRKSGTFTGLDFAPPTRLRDVDSGSDAGSIRSGRSGMSQAQVYALRSGAHRVSRLPKNIAGTKDDIMAGLKPKWDLTY
ncbi:hypothetical protein EJ08DRAFT_696002 [Tothia fuscella]|uniref:Uncharacterized protein n=1 Tax=Tothia fuscella TaxID=1048955 RepID=A0A9P4NUE8_9PEZI|nr:hypothetical protein EJ08DRAFT_696002 [Tothia fuscella]